MHLVGAEEIDQSPEIDDDEGYLQHTGPAEGMIGEVYQRDRDEAQDLGRHKSMETTREAYSMHLRTNFSDLRLKQVSYQLIGPGH